MSRRTARAISSSTVGGDYLRLEADRVALTRGPFTIEAWVRPRALDGRRGVVTRSEAAGFGLVATQGRLVFSVPLEGRRVAVEAQGPALALDRWQHVAGVFDGGELRLYLNGTLVGRTEARGALATPEHALLIGAELDGRGTVGRFFEGDVDELRLSRGERYTTERFTPARRLSRQSASVLRLSLDAPAGAFALDASEAAAHPALMGDPRHRFE